MDILILALAAFFTSYITFFSGFGLGTVLLPVFALFFPLEAAVGLTGAVHFLNNLFKFFIIKKEYDFEVLKKFGIPSVLGAVIGSSLLIYLSLQVSVYEYDLYGRKCSITAMKSAVASAMFCFAVFETVPRWKNMQIGRDKMIFGGLLSGFFGGLSGHQGALRSVFLSKSGLSKEAFVTSGIIIACAVDFTRISVYMQNFLKLNLQNVLPGLGAAVLSAFAGAYIGNRRLEKVSLKSIQNTVAVLLFLFSLFLGAGII